MQCTKSTKQSVPKKDRKPTALTAAQTSKTQAQNRAKKQTYTRACEYTRKT